MRLRAVLFVVFAVAGRAIRFRLLLIFADAPRSILWVKPKPVCGLARGVSTTANGRPVLVEERLGLRVGTQDAHGGLARVNTDSSRQRQ